MGSTGLPGVRGRGWGAPVSAPGFAPASVGIHHEIPRCLLRLRDRAEAAGLTGEGIELALEFEHEAQRWGLDPDVSREDLAALIEGSTVEILAEEHRDGHASDFARWGRRGGLVTVRRYGTAWFRLLAARRWQRISDEELARTFTAINGGWR